MKLSEAEAQELSKLLFEAREQVEMFTDIVEGQTGRVSPHQRELVERLDNFRRKRGWSPSGFGDEVALDAEGWVIRGTDQEEVTP